MPLWSNRKAKFALAVYRCDLTKIEKYAEEDWINQSLLSSRKGYSSGILSSFRCANRSRREILWWSIAERSVEEEMDGFTPLVGACCIRHINMVELLLQHGADPNQHSKDGVTPLIKATWSNSLDIMQLLLAHNADMEGRNDQGDTAMSIAIGRCDTEDFRSVRFLLEQGANTNVCNTEGDTPLLLACRRNARGETSKSIELVKMLIEHGAYLNVANRHQVTPLWLTVVRNHVFTLEYLLQQGAYPDCRRHGDITPLLWASRQGQLETVSLLCRYGADVNVTDVEGNSVLMLASASGHPRVVSFLLRKGAEVELRNCQGFSALEMAEETSLETFYHLIRLRPHILPRLH